MRKDLRVSMKDAILPGFRLCLLSPKYSFFLVPIRSFLTHDVYQNLTFA